MHKAKAYLSKYLIAKRRADRINEQIEEIRARYALPMSPELSDMPKAHNTERDLSDYMARLDELTGYLITQYCKCIGIEGDILKRLDLMENESERELLRLRYINGLDWKDLMEMIPYSDRHVYRLHGDALDHFPLPKDVSECQ